MNKTNNGPSVGKFLINIKNFWSVLSRLIRYGRKRFVLKDIYTIAWIAIIGIISVNLSYNHYFLEFYNKVLPYIFTDWVNSYLELIPWQLYLVAFLMSFYSFSFLGLGLKELKMIKRLQENLDLLAFKSGDGTKPKIMDVVKIDDNKSKVIVHSPGIPASRYKSKKDDLASAFGKIIDEVKPSKNLKRVEFSMMKKALPTLVKYFDNPLDDLKPAEFAIGESISGFMKGDLTQLPHMMIAGATGGGKSVFFKQTLLTLMKSTTNVQVYLIDLKKGIEMQCFAGLPNVHIATNETEAVGTLTALKKEMDRRFDYLKAKKLNHIHPETHKMDRIIIGVDEASVLYLPSKVNKEKQKKINQARELTEEISKLSRAASMHLILATQKVSKNTIDTNVQENILGRMCFKMNSIQGSSIVLNNKSAVELPNVKGRGIWTQGSEQHIVQTPLLTEEQLAEEIEHLSGDYKSKDRKFFGPMLETTFGKIVNKDTKLLKDDKQ